MSPTRPDKISATQSLGHYCLQLKRRTTRNSEPKELDHLFEGAERGGGKGGTDEAASTADGSLELLPAATGYDHGYENQSKRGRTDLLRDASGDHSRAFCHSL